jgi:hypothetical protein
VDKNLEDDWLVRLNGLDSLKLISICEGHCRRQTEPLRTPPHIKLRLKESFLPGIACRWDEHKMAVLNEINKLFQAGNTYVNLELKFKLRQSLGRLTYQEDLTLRIHSRQARTSEEMDAETSDWFRQSVSRVEELDRFVVYLWGLTEEGA